MLSEENVNIIKTEIEKSAITIPELKDDLLDHFCCFIEYEMKKGVSFERAYQKAFEEVCPNGLDEIQKETIFLLNSKKIVIMKQVMYSIGLLAAISTSIGWLFKLMYWTGASILFNGGFLAFVLIFLPMLAIDRFKVNLNNAMSERFKVVLGFSSALVTGVAVLFKIMHLQGADILLVAGILLFSLGFLPFLFFRTYKKSFE